MSHAVDSEFAGSARCFFFVCAFSVARQTSALTRHNLIFFSEFSEPAHNTLRRGKCDELY
jgi:hypothetical protein